MSIEEAANEKNGAANDKLLKSLEADTQLNEANNETMERETWSGRLDFLMSALSFAVGNGNLWRFPYLCYKNGGGAFLIPYVIMVMLVGIPLVFLEMSLGQYSRRGIVPLWRICPLFEGIGWAMFLISIVLAVYYNLLISYCFHYFFASFTYDLPWRTCGNSWNTEDCFSYDDALSSSACNSTGGIFFNKTCLNSTDLLNKAIFESNTTGKRVSPSDEYFHRSVLEISGSIENLGGVKWQLALCLLLCWTIIAICLAKGIKLSGKVTYVTAIVPYVLLAIMCVKGLTLDGAMNGIWYYISPNWNILFHGKVWVDAAVQVAFSLSICWGGTIHLSSHNKFKNNCLRDAIIIAGGDTMISIFAGIVIFAFIGYMAHIMDVKVSDVATTGAGLAFIVYAQAITTLPISQLWSALFMLVLINIGIGTMFTVVQTIQMTLIEVFPRTLFKGRRPMYTLWALCILMYLIALVMCTRGGMYILQLLDTYGATYANLVLIILLCLVVAWIYGVRHYMARVREMIGSSVLLPFFGISWACVTPLVVMVVFIYSLADVRRTSYGIHVFPKYVDAIGWMIVGIELLIVLGVALYKIITTKEPAFKLLQSADPWSVKEEYKSYLYTIVPLDKFKQKKTDIV